MNKHAYKFVPRIKRRDANHAEIQSALQQAYISVLDIHNVGMGIGDLLTGAQLPCPHCAKKFPQNLLIEIKVDEKSSYTPAEKKFQETWRGQKVVVYTREDAMRLHGVKL